MVEMFCQSIKPSCETWLWDDVGMALNVGMVLRISYSLMIILGLAALRIAFMDVLCRSARLINGR